MVVLFDEDKLNADRERERRFFCEIFREMMTEERCKTLEKNDPHCMFCTRYGNDPDPLEVA